MFAKVQGLDGLGRLCVEVLVILSVHRDRQKEILEKPHEFRDIVLDVLRQDKYTMTHELVWVTSVFKPTKMEERLLSRLCCEKQSNYVVL